MLSRRVPGPQIHSGCDREESISLLVRNWTPIRRSSIPYLRHVTGTNWL